ncbi:type II toxin-antitoxin system HicA family toxin [Amycolatopsis palatopharyngis]|uniref:type II toxin-antitoxin system HicA family toxin n=1 Tax=Amycolatopsis palatopharyngis TaxID=187982 RepID=UPI000E2504A7
MSPEKPADPELPSVLNQTTAVKLLKRHGWEKTQGTRHIKMIKPGHRPITLPRHTKDYSVRLSRAIMKQAGIIAGGTP